MPYHWCTSTSHYCDSKSLTLKCIKQGRQGQSRVSQGRGKAGQEQGADMQGQVGQGRVRAECLVCKDRTGQDR